MKTFFIVAFLFIAIITAAQPLNIDSLKKEFEKGRQNSSEVKALVGLISYYQNSKPDSAIYYARLLIKLSQKLNDKYNEAHGFQEYALALNYSGNFPEALQMVLNEKKIAEDLYKEGKPERLIMTHLVLGVINRSSSRYANAMANFKESIRLAKASGQKEESFFGFFSELAGTYLESEKLDSALFYAKKGYQLSLNSTDKRKITLRIPLMFNVLARVYEKLGNYDTAQGFYHLSIAHTLKNNQFFELAKDYGFLAGLHKKQGEQDSCIFYAKKSVELRPNSIYAANSYDLLAQMYEVQNKPDSTLKYMKLMLAQTERLFSQAKVTQYQGLVFNEEQRQQQLKEAELNRINRIKLYALVFIMIVSFIVTIILYRNNLQKQKANKKIAKAYEELKATQAQLIQQEKMASLGELTAGIAHEIQNPLNFVNNFSEVNKELLVEMKDQIDKGNTEEVKSIANDVIENEEKINHHGKRADAIVKGMLQHSRSNAGQKELTDINKLADEYLRLCYHGLRAKDQFFNATMQTDFDESIEKINIVLQDIGRVLLNLFTNAFYAVNEKKQMNVVGYEPTVTVTTKRIGEKIEIKVADNGNGIPQKVLDKIFQPFFTTKPTGQGTGLGLSLSYDIIKAHGGEIKVETKEGEFSEFTIILPLKENSK